MADKATATVDTRWQQVKKQVSKVAREEVQKATDQRFARMEQEMITILDTRDASLRMRIQYKADLAVSQAQEDLEGAKAVWDENLHTVRRTLATDFAADWANIQNNMADLRTTTATAAQRMNERPASRRPARQGG